MKKWIIAAIVLAVVLVITVVAIFLVNRKPAETTWQEQYDLGMRYLSEENYEQAILAFRAAIEIDPREPRTYLMLSSCYTAIGEYALAEEVLQQGLIATDGNVDIRAEITKLQYTDTEPAASPSVSPAPEAAEGSGAELPTWKTAYEAFVLQGGYLSAGQDYDTAGEPIVMLYDMDGDGQPELILTNGSSARTERWAYIYDWANGAVRYLGIGPTDAFYIPNSVYHGLWGSYHTGSETNWTLYRKTESAVETELVYAERMSVSGTAYEPVTGDEALFAEGQREKVRLYGASVSEIRSMGWSVFLEAAELALSGEAASASPFADTYWTLAFGVTVGSQYFAYFAPDGSVYAYRAGNYEGPCFEWEETEGYLVIHGYEGRSILFAPSLDGAYLSTESFEMQGEAGYYAVMPDPDRMFEQMGGMQE